MAWVKLPTQTDWLGTGSTVGIGLTVMVKVSEVPVQMPLPDPKVGVTVIVAVTGVFVGFVATKAVILPLFAAPKLMEVVLFTQL